MAYLHFRPKIPGAHKWCRSKTVGFVISDPYNVTCPECKAFLVLRGIIEGVSIPPEEQPRHVYYRPNKGKLSENNINLTKELLKISKDGFLPYGILAQMGNKYGLTRERTRQIAKKSGLKTYGVIHKRLCDECGVEKIVNALKHEDKNKYFFCSDEHRKKFVFKKSHVKIICEECKEPKWVEKPPPNRPVYRWCSKRCFGFHIARTYGFKTSKGFDPTGKSQSKYTRKFFKENNMTSFTAVEFMEKFSLSRSCFITICKLVKRGVIVNSGEKDGRRAIYKLAKLKRKVGKPLMYPVDAEYLWDKLPKKWFLFADFEKAIGVKHGWGKDLFANYRHAGIVKQVGMWGKNRIYKLNYKVSN